MITWRADVRGRRGEVAGCVGLGEHPDGDTELAVWYGASGGPTVVLVLNSREIETLGWKLIERAMAVRAALRERGRPRG